MVIAKDILFFRRNTEEESADDAQRDLKIAEGKGLPHICSLLMCFNEEEKGFIA